MFFLAGGLIKHEETTVTDSYRLADEVLKYFREKLFYPFS